MATTVINNIYKASSVFLLTVYLLCTDRTISHRIENKQPNFPNNNLNCLFFEMAIYFSKIRLDRLGSEMNLYLCGYILSRT